MKKEAVATELGDELVGGSKFNANQEKKDKLYLITGLNMTELSNRRCTRKPLVQLESAIPNQPIVC